MKTSDQNQPHQYKKGYAEFYKLKFKVTPDVLIPRPETELLVDEVLKFLKSHSGQELTVMDIGTGSGCIATSIAKNHPHCKIIATDISAKAIAVAKQNAKFHQVEDRITFLKRDLLSAFPSSHPDLIVTNLPYIPDYRIPYLDPSVKDFEPHVALNGGSDGFDLYRKLFQQIIDKNVIPKLLIGEIDYTQSEAAQEEASKYFKDARVEIKHDLAHQQRILSIHF